jgi:hypothetical protein
MTEETSQPTPAPETSLYRWRIKDPTRRTGWRELAQLMTVEVARNKHGDKVEMIEGSGRQNGEQLIQRVRR